MTIILFFYKLTPISFYHSTRVLLIKNIKKLILLIINMLNFPKKGKIMLNRIIYLIFAVILLNNLSYATLYEDAEDNTTESWSIYDNVPEGATITALYDTDINSTVIDLNGTGESNGYILGSFTDIYSWRNTKESILKFRMKSSENYTIYILVKTLKGDRYLYYTDGDANYGKGETSIYIHHGLGVGTQNGQWREYSRDLDADLAEFESDNEIISINAFLVRGSIRVDNIELVANPNRPKEALILYDRAGDYGEVGKEYAMLLENLLGHFKDLSVISKPADEYLANDMNKKMAIFYIGSTYDVLSYYPVESSQREAYENFFRDIAYYNHPIAWMNYNLYTLEEFWMDNYLNDTSFADTYGFHFYGTSWDAHYNRVEYKDTELFKGVIPFATPGADISACEDEGDNRYACEEELGILEIVDENKTDIVATAYSTLTSGSETPTKPYITRGNDNFWYVGDIPFTYMSEEDRYLAFSDLLHDILGIDHAESHKAIMRLEDVDARTEMSDLNVIANYMNDKNIPFSVATIPLYKDPLGIENDGVSTTVSLSDSSIGNRLKELYNQGRITIVQHGTTHQFSTDDMNESEIRNPYNGLSGDDFEFMRVVEVDPNQPYLYLHPIMNDSPTWARDRINSGKSILAELDIDAFCWEAPHYMAGAKHYRAIKNIYPVQYARMLYYPNEDSNDTEKKSEFIGQFYPYVIEKDLYGYKIIPENIHNIENEPNEGYRAIFPSDIIRFSKKLKVVRDGVASFFYHPYLRDQYLPEIIDGLEAEGYQFVSAPTLIE